ncbi:MAG: right-handed parallel beta-helix repeat-containing protein [Dehalococcoidales bacterium]|nr:right-handed parallel beta-helix repeat-containing protein [Dehalococcoidales bacterium]
MKKLLAIPMILILILLACIPMACETGTSVSGDAVIDGQEATHLSALDIDDNGRDLSDATTPTVAKVYASDAHLKPAATDATNMVWLCDGVSDETEINAALDAVASYKGQVHLSQGTFNITAKVTVHADTELVGAGKTATVINSSGIAWGCIILQADATIRDLHLKGDGTTTYEIGIGMDAAGCQAINVKVEDCKRSNISCGAVSGIKIVNCESVDCKSYESTSFSINIGSIATFQTGDVLITGLYSHDNDGPAIHTYSNRNGTLTITDWLSVGDREGLHLVNGSGTHSLTACGPINIINPTLKDTIGMGIEGSGNSGKLANVSILGGTFDNVGDNAIDPGGSYGWTISGVHINGVNLAGNGALEGYGITNGRGMRVFNSTIEHCWRAGICVFDENDCVISGNLLRNNNQGRFAVGPPWPADAGVFIWAENSTTCYRTKVVDNVFEDTQATAQRTLSEDTGVSPTYVKCSGNLDFFYNQRVYIHDSAHSEYAYVLRTSWDGSYQEVYFRSALTYAYTTANGAYIQGKATQGYGIVEDEHSDTAPSGDVDYTYIVGNTFRDTLLTAPMHLIGPADMVQSNIGYALDSKGPSVLTVAASDAPLWAKSAANYVCDGTNDNTDVATALAAGDHVVGVGGTFHLGAQLTVANGKTLEFVGGASVVPSSDIDMFFLEVGSSLIGLHADVTGLGDGGFTKSVVTFDGTGCDGWYYNKNSIYTDWTIRSGATDWEGAWTPSGTAINMACAGSEAELQGISSVIVQNYRIIGQFEYGIRLYAGPSTNFPTYVNGNQFENGYIDSCKYFIAMIGTESGASYGDVDQNIFNGLQTNASSVTQYIIKTELAHGNLVSDAVIWDWQLAAGTYAIDLSSRGNRIEFQCANDLVRDGNTIDRTGQNRIINYRSNYIAPGEVRTYSGTLTAGNADAIAFYWSSPNISDILIKSVVIEITTIGGTANSVMDVGIADDATGTNLGVEFFDALDLQTAQINDSYVPADMGTQVKYVLCQDSASATDAFVVGKILVANAANLVGRWYIECIGR